MSNTKHTLSLTDAEAYILACVMGNLRYNDNPSVNSLLSKISGLSYPFNIDVEDYDKVSAYVDFNGGCEEGYKLCKSLFFTLDFDGSNVDLGENVELVKETTISGDELKSRLHDYVVQAQTQEESVSTESLLFSALRVAIKENDLDAVQVYSNTIQTLSTIL
ncbi:hypothetical protein [Pseudomonas sp.]|uniref:hypothetical protein n=1 Tax=Pseudomonas sp. TaxID=306 RepID=UPI003FD845AF